MKTNSLSEARYLLLRAMRTRGFNPELVGDRSLNVVTPDYNFSLSFMPGNRRVLISHKVFIHPASRNRGLGKKLLAMREELAREAGINLLLATVKNDNEVEIHLLKKAKWERMVNRLGTKTSLWGKKL